eukprot:scaffold144943_cov28-Attheya_sp.AAC.1
MQMPWFGANQPGETYYYPPLNVYNLGVVDPAHSDKPGDGETEPKDRLYSHVYDEGLGKRGGSNVASLIMKT